MPEESLPIDAARLCFEPKFLSDEKSFEDLLDGSTPPVVVEVVASDAILLTVNDGVAGTFGREASVDEDDEVDDEVEGGSGG